MKISPSEAWSMDLLEIVKLLGIPDKEKQDLSLMLNYERMQNGATKEFLQLRNSNGN